MLLGILNQRLLPLLKGGLGLWAVLAPAMPATAAPGLATSFEKAAAATGVIQADPARIYPTFRADRPFLFLIRDKTTGSILFMGRYAMPAE